MCVGEGSIMGKENLLYPYGWSLFHLASPHLYSQVGHTPVFQSKSNSFSVSKPFIGASFNHY